MLITLTKKESKPHVLTCRRDDGTSTWFQASQANADFFAAHDLSHYAIETVLEYRSAFYGMVASGRDLNDFGSQGGLPDTRTYSKEALWAENMANLMLLCLRENKSYEEFRSILQLNYVSNPEDAPPVSEEQYLAIQEKLRDLLARWKALPINESMTLEFGWA